MFFKTFAVGEMLSNCFIIVDEETKTAAVVDPGADIERIKNELDGLDAKVEKILLTHGHIDHIGAVNPLKKLTGAPVWIHPKDNEMLGNPMLNLSAFIGTPLDNVVAENTFQEGDEIEIGNIKTKIIETPGHTPGSVSLLFDDRLISGDCLFRDGMGRTDFPGGDFNVLKASIERLCSELDESMEVFPGHGPTTTIGHEKKFNPIFSGMAF